MASRSQTTLRQALLEDAPKALWMLDDTAADAQFVDLSGFGKHSSSVGGSIAYNRTPTTPDGKVLGAGPPASSASSAYRTTFPDPAVNFGPGQAATLEMWTKLVTPPGASGPKIIFGKGTSTTNHFTMYWSSSGTSPMDIVLFYHNGSVETYIVIPLSSGKGAVTGVMRHLAFTFSAANVLKVYVDGVPSLFNVFEGAGSLYDQASFTSGNRINPGTDWYHGYSAYYTASPSLDHAAGPIALYQSELSAARVLAHYRESLRGGVSGGGYG